MGYQIVHRFFFVLLSIAMACYSMRSSAQEFDASSSLESRIRKTLSEMLNRFKAEMVYRSLEQSPFASLYSWNSYH